MNFRYMTEDDLHDVLRNERQAYSHPWTEAVFLDSLGGLSDCWVAEFDEEIVGHIVLSHVLDEGHILNLCIGPAWQGQGWGDVLLEFTMKRLHILEVATVFLEVRVSNQAARSLYGKHGFSEIGLRKNYYPDGAVREDAIVMRKLLTVDIAT